MEHPPLHPALESLGFLLGTWRGEGHGIYPTIEDFSYVEEVTYTHVGKPFIAYAQKTRDAETGEPLHAEAGYIRPVGAGAAELVLVQPSGIVEVADGVVDGAAVEFTAAQVMTTPTAKSVTEVRRALEVVADELRYEVDMAAVGQPLQLHLEATLHRA